MKKSQVILISVSILISCIDPIDVKTGSRGGLVVDGLVTNVSGTSVVKLSRSLAFDNTGIISSYFDPEKNATVIIQDNAGNEILLYEGEPGIYKTNPEYAGTIGKEYTIHIQTNDGQVYSSTPEVMNPVPQIDDILYQYYVYEILIENAYGQSVPDLRFGFKIMVQSTDPVDEENYFRWKTRGIFEFFSFIGETLLQCWVPVPRLESNLKIMDDLYLNGNSFIEEIAVIPYDRPTYYQVTVQQHSMSAEAYRFWNDVKSQQENTGSIFDPIPSQIKGNIYNTADPDEVVMGYFSASAIAEKTVLIDRWQTSGRVSPSPNILPQMGNCINQIQNATNIKPPGFP